MAEDRIPAEVVPAQDHSQEAATALRARGFRVLHVGRSISVDAPRAGWEEIFGVSFTPHTKTVQKAIGGEHTYLRAESASVRIPAELADLIAEIAFMEPPELH